MSKKLPSTVAVPGGWGGGGDGAPGVSPHGPKCSQFHAVFRKIWKNHMLGRPGGLAPHPAWNPGSAPEVLQ